MQSESPNLKAPGLDKHLSKRLSSDDYLREISPHGSVQEDTDSFMTAPPGHDRDGDVTEVEKALD
eukprot:333830-Amphidinium_carterae.2